VSDLLPAGTVRVVAQAHPFHDDPLEAHVPAGQTLVEIMGRDDLPAVVYADGAVIEREQWATFRPEQFVLIRRCPQGDIGRILGTIAVVVAAAYFAPIVAGAAGFTAGTAAFSAATAAITAGFTVVGQLALNALVPPPVPGQPSQGVNEDVSFITGQSNRIAPFSPIPRLYGQRQFFPPIPMTARPYTELVGSDQYLRMMLILGYGPLDIGGVTAGAGEALITEATSLTGDPIKIGGTAIDQIDGIEFEIGDPDDVTLYVQSITELAVGVSLDPSAAPTGRNQTITDGDSAIRTTETDTDEISLDVVFPALFSVSSDGDTRFVSVTFRVEYSPAGAGTWTTLDSAWEVSGRNRSPVRSSRRYTLPSSGEYDIRLTRVESFYERGTDAFADGQWSVLRSIKRNERPFDVDDVVVMALRVPAESVSGIVDRVSVEATSILDVWNGSSWVAQSTRNPAWAYVDLLTGSATRSPMSKSNVDATTLKSWADWCDTEGLYFDAVYDADGTVFDRLREVASAGLGAWAISDDGAVSIIRDIAGQTPRMLITPRIASGFRTERVFREFPHALRVQFIDPTTWEPTERIVYDDGYTAANATRFTQLRTIGVTDADQAWKLGRYHVAQLRLRPEVYTWQQGIQHLAFDRGDTVEVAQDSILVGLKWGRIKAVTVDGSGDALTADVDELLEMESGTSYALKIQRRDGTIVTEGVTTVTPSTETVTFDSPVEDLQEGDSFIFGVAGSESLLARITRIDPVGDFDARVTAVPAAEDIFDAWTGTIPAWNPVITETVDQDLLPPNQPELKQITSGVQAGTLGLDKAQAVVMAVEFQMPPGLVGVEVQARIRNRETPDAAELTTAWVVAASAPSEVGVILIGGVEVGHVYDVQIRGRRGRRVSSWTSTTTHTVSEGRLYGKSGGQNLLTSDAGPEQSGSPSGYAHKYLDDVLIETLSLAEGDLLSLSAFGKADGTVTGGTLRLELLSAGDVVIETYELDDFGTAYAYDEIDAVEIPAATNGITLGLYSDGGSGTLYAKQVMLNIGGFALPFQEPPARVNRGEVEEGATKNNVFRQTTAPTAESTGDLWFDIDDDILYRWDGSFWVEIGNAFDDTADLTDGALLGETAVWSTVTGTGKPADDATKNVIYRQTSAPSASNAGDVWFDIDDDLLYRSNGSSWQLVGNAYDLTSQLTDDDQLGETAIWASVSGSGKPADSATVNRIFRQTTAPSGQDGDLWFDWDDDLLYRHNGSGWQLVGNAYDNTSQLSDGANLGDTAQWGSVSGSGKPENNATQGLIDASDATTDGETTVSSTSWTTVQTETQSFSGTREVIVTVTCNLRRNDGNDQSRCEVRVTRNGVEIGGLSAGEFILPGNQAFNSFVYRAQLSLTGSHTFDLDVAKLSGGGNVGVRNRVITVEEVL
jgi:hypothetical protein